MALELRKFAADTSYNLIRQVIAVVLRLITSVLVARTLGVTNKGTFALIVLLPSILKSLLNLGITPAISYYIARGDHNLKIAVRGSISLCMWISAIGMIIGIAVAFMGEFLFPNVLPSLLLLGLLIFPIDFFYNNLRAIFLGMQKFKLYNALEILPEILNLGLCFLFLWILKLSVVGATLGTIIANLATTAVAVLLLRKQVNVDSIFALLPDPAFIRSVFRYGLKAYASNLVSFLNYRADMFILNLFTTPAVVGFYSIAVGLAEKLWIVSQAAGYVIFPRIASMEGAKDRRRQLTPIVARHIFLVSFVLCILLFFMAEWLINLLYGSEFREATVALRILMPGVAMMSLTKILANDIAGRGRPEINSLAGVITLSINVLLNITLIPRFGLMGVALACTISYIIQSVIIVFYYRKLSDVGLGEILIFNRSDFKLWKGVVRTIGAKKA